MTGTVRGWVAATALLALTLGIAGCAGQGGGGAPDGEAADLVLFNGKLITLDDATEGSTALAARDGKIVAVGSDDEIRALIGDRTEEHDLQGRTAIPGFIEGHGHFVGLGQALLRVDLTGFRSWNELVAHLGEVASQREPGEWILGRGWHQDKWDTAPAGAVEGYPPHDALSAVTPDNPVLLVHASGHASLANTRAMELAGLDRDTPDPQGGEILHDATGEPTGVLRERATGLVRSVATAALAEQADELALQAIAAAGEECLSKGVTSFQDAGSSFETVELLRAAAARGDLDVRLWMMLSESNATLAERLPGYEVHREADGRITVGGIKRWLDGALGAHGAWLLAPYEDLPESTGINIVPLDEMAETARLAREHELQLCVHAIGDRANRETLDLFEATFEGGPTLASRRWRVEHAQHLDPADAGRFAGLGVVASMQSVHCTSDGPWVPSRLGDRRSEQGAYVWRTLLDSGAVIVNGTDAPVEDIDPIANFAAAVTRRMPNGDAFYPEQVMTRREALESMTLQAAWGAFEDDVKGSLSIGKYADVVVLSKDPLKAPEEQLGEMRVLATIVGGKVLYRVE